MDANGRAMEPLGRNKEPSGCSRRSRRPVVPVVPKVIDTYHVEWSQSALCVR